MGYSVGQSVHGPVPAVDGTVVEHQFLQPRHPAFVEDPQRILLVAHREQRRKVTQVLLEELVRRADPPLTEPGPGPYSLVLEFGRPGVGGLLEERRPRFPPQLPAEQEGRVGPQCDLDPGDGLGGVPHGRESRRCHLQMELDRGAGGLGGDRGGGAHQSLHALDIEGEILAPRSHHLIVQQCVAVRVREVRHDEVLAAQGGQNTDHHDPGIDLARLPVGISEPGPELLGQLIENASVQTVRDYVHFQIEHPEFGLEITARDAREDLPIHHLRHAVGTREIQLDLHAHEVARPVEPPFRQKPLQSLQALVELLPVPLPIGQVKGARHDLLPHRSVPPSVGGPRPRPLASRSIMPRPVIHNAPANATDPVI